MPKKPVFSAEYLRIMRWPRASGPVRSTPGHGRARNRVSVQLPKSMTSAVFRCRARNSSSARRISLKTRRRSGVGVLLAEEDLVDRPLDVLEARHPAPGPGGHPGGGVLPPDQVDQFARERLGLGLPAGHDVADPLKDPRTLVPRPCFPLPGPRGAGQRGGGDDGLHDALLSPDAVAVSVRHGTSFRAVPSVTAEPATAVSPVTTGGRADRPRRGFRPGRGPPFVRRSVACLNPPSVPRRRSYASGAVAAGVENRGPGVVTSAFIIRIFGRGQKKCLTALAGVA